LKEIHRASGGPWGGTKVDDAFQEYLLELFGFETITSLPKNEVIELERSFESFKRKIDTGSTVYYMQIPLSLRQSAPPGTLVASKLKLQSEKVKEFFDKPIKTICAHIRKMISAMPLDELKTILLVGGFSESKLLQEGIQRYFPSIAVRTPSGPSTAVVKGAVEKNRFRMSPYTYGVNTTIPFRHGIHPEQKLCVYKGTEYCEDVFSVHVKIDQ
jgi:molecular chaperone DnaK (HSP70)